MQKKMSKQTAKEVVKMTLDLQHRLQKMLKAKKTK